MRKNGATLTDIAHALKRDLGIDVRPSSLSKRLSKLEGMPRSNAGRPRKEPGAPAAAGSEPRVVAVPAPRPR